MEQELNAIKITPHSITFFMRMGDGVRYGIAGPANRSTLVAIAQACLAALVDHPESDTTVHLPADSPNHAETLQP